MDFEEQKQALIESYRQLIELQYHGKEKAVATVKLNCEELLTNLLLMRIREECLNIDLSVGVQLDIVGKWVGLDRYWKGSEYDKTRHYAYYDWNDETQPNNLQAPLIDWNVITDPDGGFLDYDMIVSVTNRLRDEDFRTLIKLKIIKNSINMTCKNIDDSINNLFKDTVSTLWGECMELTYIYPKEYELLFGLAKEKNVLPIPTGVKVNLQTQ